MERPFHSRYVVVLETHRPNVKTTSKVVHTCEAWPTLREAKRELAKLEDLHKKSPHKKAFIVDQDKQPDFQFIEVEVK